MDKRSSKEIAGDGNNPSPPSPNESKSGPVRDRHARIVETVREQGFVTIETLAQQFNVTPQTIRRDINTLSTDGLLLRYHGGAANALSTENVSYPERQVLCLREKQKIAHTLARHIPNHASLFINIGTTTEAVAEALCSHRGLRVITNNLNVASILKKNDSFEVIVAGGVVRSRDGGIIGEATVDFIRQFKVDFGIIGISGIDLDGTLLDFDYREVRAARAIIDNSRTVYLAADHTKFGRNAMVRLGNLSEIHALFTDRPLPEALHDYLETTETRLFVAGED